MHPLPLLSYILSTTLFSAQTAYFLHTNDIRFRIFYPAALSITCLIASAVFDIQNESKPNRRDRIFHGISSRFYIIATSTLLSVHWLTEVFPPFNFRTYNIQTGNNGTRVAMSVWISGCVNTRFDIQSVEPIEWGRIGSTIQLFNLTLFSDFRILGFCENGLEPVASDIMYWDGMSLRWAGKSYDTPHAIHRLEQGRLLVGVPTKNPFYGRAYRTRDRVVHGLYLVLALKCVLHMLYPEEYQPSNKKTATDDDGGKKGMARRAVCRHLTNLWLTL